MYGLSQKVKLKEEPSLSEANKTSLKMYGLSNKVKLTENPPLSEAS
jgi:hypothetical protein